MQRRVSELQRGGITQQPVSSWLQSGNCIEAKQLPLQKEGKEAIAQQDRDGNNTQLGALEGQLGHPRTTATGHSKSSHEPVQQDPAGGWGVRG